MDKKGKREGVSRVLVENFLSTLMENFVGEAFSVSLFQVSKKIKEKKGREGEIDDMPSRLFCLIVRKHFVEEASVL